MTEITTEPILTVEPHDFACWCPDSNVRTKAVVAWVMQKLECTRENLPSAVVYALDRYEASIDMIATDMWGVIGTSIAPGFIRGSDKGTIPEHQRFLDEPFSTYIQFDDFTDGLAFTFKAYFDRFGDKPEP